MYRHRAVFRWTILLISLSVAVIIFGFACKAYKEKSYVIGIINPNPGEKDITNSFIDNMKTHGYIEGKNVNYIISEKREDIKDEVDEMVKKHVDLIMTVTTPATRGAKEGTKGTGIPVVFVMHDPVASGLVNGLSRPGGNLTGIQLRGSTPKTLQWLLTCSPGIKNVFVPVAFDTKAARQSLEDLKQAAEKLMVKLSVSEVATAEDLMESLSSIPEDIDAIFILHSILINANLESVIKAADERKILTASAGHEHYENGVAISYGHRNDRIGEQISRLADKILHGASPETLPVENADYFLGINLQTVRRLGIEIPEEVLKQADYIIR